MIDYFTSEQRIEALHTSAKALDGTPWKAHSKSPGYGMSCHFAVAWVLEQAGHRLSDVPDGASNWSKHHTRSIMEDWLDASPAFRSVPLDDPAPGDVIGFKVGLCIHHLGLILPGGLFFCCLEPRGAVIAGLTEPHYRKHAARLWRPLET